MARRLAHILQNKDLRRRLLFTLAILTIYRLGIFIPLPGVDRGAWVEIVQGWDSTILEVLSIFTGGGFQMASVCALGILPFIFAGLLAPLFLSDSAHGEDTRKLESRGRWLTLFSGMIGGVLLAFLLEHHDATPELDLIGQPGWIFRLQTGFAVTAGTALVMWIIKQVNQRGVGDGVSLLIVANVLSCVPAAIKQLLAKHESPALSALTLVIAALIVLAMMTVVVFFENACRYVSVKHEERVVAARTFGGQPQQLPLRLNMVDFKPALISSCVLVPLSVMAACIDSHMWAQTLAAALEAGDWRYGVLFTLLTIFLCFLVTAVEVDPDDLAAKLKESGAFIPGVQPGKETAAYFNAVSSRLTFAAGVYISVVCLIPFIIQDAWDLSLCFGGLSILIVVIVGRQTVSHLETRLSNERD